jgi:uncharacterized protein YaaQ
MKAIIAVVQGQDTARVSQALRQKGIAFTTIDSTGGFLRERNATFMIGIADEDLEAVVDVLAANSHTRSEYVSSYPSAFDPAEFYMPRPIEVQVGGATVWVLDVEHYEPL